MFVCACKGVCVFLFDHVRRAYVFLTSLFFSVCQQKKQTKTAVVSHQFRLLLSLLQVLLHMACDSTEGRSGLSSQ